MARLFEEIDSQSTAIGEISLRKRVIPAVGPDPIFEVKLGEEFLMSSLFVAAEEALSEQGLAACDGRDLRVVVGGLGLGYTARAALECERVGELVIVEALAPVIDWHRRELVPLGPALNADPRCHYRQGDFFELARTSFDADRTLWDAVLLDIDHSPTEYLAEGNAGFYSPGPLNELAAQIRPGGVFAMWSQNPPDDGFKNLLLSAFSEVQAHKVRFYNPFQSVEASNTVYVARR